MALIGFRAIAPSKAGTNRNVWAKADVYNRLGDSTLIRAGRLDEGFEVAVLTGATALREIVLNLAA